MYTIYNKGDCVNLLSHDGGGVCGQGNDPFVHIVRLSGFFGVLNSNLEEFFGSPPPGGVHGGGKRDFYFPTNIIM